MAIAPTQLPPQPPGDEIEYPITDGKPMAESDLHQELMIYCKQALQTHFADDPDTYISSDNFLYYLEGVPAKVVSPDCYVVYGVGNELRDLYKVWEEGGQTPAVVFEITSKSTQKEDTGKKFRIYEQDLHVPEYFLFDPTGDYLNPILQGYRLVNGRYTPLALQNDRLFSEQLGLELVIQSQMLRLFNPITGKWLLTAQEQRVRAEMEARARVQAEQRAQEESQARLEAEAQIARLMAEMEALRQKE